MVAAVRVRVAFNDDFGNIRPISILKKHIQVKRDDFFQRIHAFRRQFGTVVAEKDIGRESDGTGLGVYFHCGIAEGVLQGTDNIRPYAYNILQLAFGGGQLGSGTVDFRIGFCQFGLGHFRVGIGFFQLIQ